jgi:hypothetical protein
MFHSLSLRERVRVRGKLTSNIPLILIPAGAHDNHVRPFDGAEAR